MLGASRNALASDPERIGSCRPQFAAIDPTDAQPRYQGQSQEDPSILRESPPALPPRCFVRNGGQSRFPARPGGMRSARRMDLGSGMGDSEEARRVAEKTDYLDRTGSTKHVEWRLITPNERHIWLTEGLEADFDRFLPLGVKARAAQARGPAIFEEFCNGVKSNNDAYVYDFSQEKLFARAKRMVDGHNQEQVRYRRKKDRPDPDALLRVDVKVLKWIRKTKQHFKQSVSLTRGPRSRSWLWPPR